MKNNVLLYKLSDYASVNKPQQQAGEK